MSIPYSPFDRDFEGSPFDRSHYGGDIDLTRFENPANYAASNYEIFDRDRNKFIYFQEIKQSSDGSDYSVLPRQSEYPPRNELRDLLPYEPLPYISPRPKIIFVPLPNTTQESKGHVSSADAQVAVEMVDRVSRPLWPELRYGRVLPSFPKSTLLGEITLAIDAQGPQLGIGLDLDGQIGFGFGTNLLDPPKIHSTIGSTHPAGSEGFLYEVEGEIDATGKARAIQDALDYLAQRPAGPIKT